MTRREKVDALLAQARERRAARPPQERDAGVGDVLAAELDEWRPSIRQANTAVLGDP